MTSEPFGFIITPAARKRLKPHRHAEKDFLRAFKSLTINPELGEELKGMLAGFRAMKVHVKGSGEYRILYDVDELTSTVVVHWVGTRENFYEEAVRHLFG